MYVPDLDPLSHAENRLQTDAFFGVLNFPENDRDAYLKEGFALIRTVKNQPEKVKTVIASYIHYCTEPTLRFELEQFLQSLPKKEDPQ